MVTTNEKDEIMGFKQKYECSKCDFTTCTYEVEHTSDIKRPLTKDDPFMCPQIGCSDGRPATWKRVKSKSIGNKAGRK